MKSKSQPAVISVEQGFWIMTALEDQVDFGLFTTIAGMVLDDPLDVYQVRSNYVERHSLDETTRHG